MGLFSSIGGILGSMVPIPGAGLIGSAVGGYLDDDSANSSRENAANTQYGQSLALADRNNAYNIERSKVEYERQKEFAQMGIRWKMDDARAAGIHPVAALGGMSGSSYSPTIVAGSSPDRGPSYSEKTYDNTSAALASMGQNTTRAQMATKTDTEKEMEGLALRRAQLQNSLLEGQVAAQWSSVMGQPHPISAPAAVGRSVAPVGAIKIEPSKVTSHAPGHSGLEAGSTPLAKSYDMGGGLRIALPSQQASEALESMGPVSAPLALTIGGARRWWHGPDEQPSMPAPKGMQWVWSPWKQSFSLERPAAPSKVHNRGSYLLRR